MIRLRAPRSGATSWTHDAPLYAAWVAEPIAVQVRITEQGDVRITEQGDVRIIEYVAPLWSSARPTYTPWE